jgi:hypothetical protein
VRFASPSGGTLAAATFSNTALRNRPIAGKLYRLLTVSMTVAVHPLAPSLPRNDFRTCFRREAEECCGLTRKEIDCILIDILSVS